MTDFNPFGAAPQEQPVAVAEEASEGRDKKVLVLGGVAALALAAGAYLFLGGGGDEELDSFAVPVRPAAAAPAVTPSPEAQIPQGTAIQLGRSPFEVKYIAPAAAPASDPAPVTPPTTAPTAAPAPQIIVFPGGGGTTTPAPAPPPASPAPPPPAVEYELTLLRAFGEGTDRSASFSIDGREQTAKVGSVFGPTAEILLVKLTEGPEVEGLVATIQVGDDDPVEVKVGERIFVR